MDLTYAEELQGIYEEAERSILTTIRRLLAKGIEVDDQHWASKKRAQIGLLKQEIYQEIRRLRAASGAKVTSAIVSSYKFGSAVGTADIAALGMTVIERDLRYGTGHGVRALAKATSDAIGSTHKRILRASLDIYRSTVAEAAGKAVTGTLTRQQAVQGALNRFADKGVTGFVDAGGRNWELFSYVDMAVRTGSSNAQRQGYEDKLIANGRDLVIVSNHASSCDSCAEWEGQILSLTGATPGYPTLADTEGGHLFGPNCGHRYNLWTEGLSTAPEIKPNDPQDYADRQRQREIERTIRQWKRREAVDITGDGQASAKVSEWQAAQREHIKQSNARVADRNVEGDYTILKRDSWREQVR